MYKVGDQFIIEITEAIKSDKGNIYRSNFSTLVFDDYGLDKLEKYNPMQVPDEIDAAYDKGLHDGWNIAKAVAIDESRGGMSNEKFHNLFGVGTTYEDVLIHLSPGEVMSKCDKYNEQFKSVTVGDIVYNRIQQVNGVVLDTGDNEGEWKVLTECGCVELWKSFVHTGDSRHIDIQSILNQIKGD